MYGDEAEWCVRYAALLPPRSFGARRPPLGQGEVIWRHRSGCRAGAVCRDRDNLVRFFNSLATRAR
jgi:hypothetical protein